MKCQKMNSNKRIHKCLYDLHQKNKEEYVKENIVYLELQLRVDQLVLYTWNFLLKFPSVS